MVCNRHLLIRRLLLQACLLLTGISFSLQAQEIPQAEGIPAPRFAIERFDVVGDRLLGEQTVQGIVGAFAGPGKDFGDVQRALEALEAAYRALGYWRRSGAASGAGHHAWRRPL